jgi:hypothetical protein
MIPTLGVTTSLPNDPTLYRRDHGVALNETLRATATMHHERHIPRHFMPFASAKYGYGKRTSVIRRERKDKSGRVVKPGLTYEQLKSMLGLPPLVSPLTTGGRTRIAVTTQRTITATQSRCTLKMRLPFSGGTGRFRMLPGQVKLSVHQQEVLKRIAEIEVIADDEQRTINQFIGNEYTRRANLPGTRHRIRKVPK